LLILFDQREHQIAQVARILSGLHAVRLRTRGSANLRWKEQSA
jgi:hypothetical protein